MTKIDRDELRLLVRQALKEALREDPDPLPVSGRPLPNPAPQGTGDSRRHVPAPREKDREAVRPTPNASAGSDDLVGQLRRALAGDAPTVLVEVASAADLDRFARDVLAVAKHRDLKAAIESGRIRFEPRGGQPAPVAAERRAPERSRESGSGRGQDTFRMDAGVLGEAALVRIGRTHTKIQIGSDVVVTPLAREKARAIKVEIERRKP